MVVTEIRKINGHSVNYTYSDTGAVLRCGRLRYKDAADPIDVHKAYFEDGVEETPLQDEATENNG